MTDEGKLIRQRTNGQKASRLWEDPMIQGFFTAVEDDIRQRWSGSLGDELEIRERAYLMLRLHENYKQQFKSYMTTGKLAGQQLLKIEESRKR